MKVYYKLDVNDIKQLIAEKYGVSTKGIGTCMTPEGPGFMVDMSKTETPEPVPFKDYVSPFLSKKEEPTEEKKGLTEEKKGPEQQDSIPTEVVPDEVYQELQYKKITDEELMKGINDGLKVRDICIAMGLKDKKYSQRLYTRVGNLKKELVKPTTEEQKAILKSLKKEQTKTKMPGIDGDIIVYTCPVCGKEFDTEKYPQYAYKKRVFNHNHVFCGYDCMRKAEKALAPEG